MRAVTVPCDPGQTAHHAFTPNGREGDFRTAASGVRVRRAIRGRMLLTDEPKSPRFSHRCLREPATFLYVRTIFPRGCIRAARLSHAKNSWLASTGVGRSDEPDAAAFRHVTNSATFLEALLQV